MSRRRVLACTTKVYKQTGLVSCRPRQGTLHCLSGLFTSDSPCHPTFALLETVVPPILGVTAMFLLPHPLLSMLLVWTVVMLSPCPAKTEHGYWTTSQRHVVNLPATNHPAVCPETIKFLATPLLRTVPSGPAEELVFFPSALIFPVPVNHQCIIDLRTVCLGIPAPRTTSLMAISHRTSSPVDIDPWVLFLAPVILWDISPMAVNLSVVRPAASDPWTMCLIDFNLFATYRTVSNQLVLPLGLGNLHLLEDHAELSF